MPRLVLQDAAAHLAQYRIFRRLGEHAKQRHGKSFSHELQADRLQVPGPGAEQSVEDFLDIVGERIISAFKPQHDVAVQYLVVPTLVDDLGCLKQFSVLTLDVFDKL